MCGQAFLEAVWFGNIALTPHCKSLVLLSVVFPPGLCFALKYQDRVGAENRAKGGKKSQVRLHTYSLYQ